MLSRRQRQTQVPHVDPRTQAHIDSRAVIGPQQRRDELMPLRVQYQVGIAAVLLRSALTESLAEVASVHASPDYAILGCMRRHREGFHV
jgi:hypothetical protein